MIQRNSPALVMCLEPLITSRQNCLKSITELMHISDLYSLGVLLYEMVTGRLPFTAESQLVVVSMHMNKRPPSPRTIVPTVSLQIERVLYKALEKRPEQRYASATVVS